jgi:anti-sigma factor ChrR (cupin superfamily)
MPAAKACSWQERILITKPLEHPFIFKNIFNIAERQHELEWLPFRDGVSVHWIYKDGAEGSAAALLKFEPGGRVNLHEHVGFEHIIVLSGSQTDENVNLPAGSLMIHQPGTCHSIVSEEGCIVLAIYEKRVSFLPQE